MKITRIQWTVFLWIILITFTSCHGDYLTVRSEFKNGVKVNEKEIVFFHYLMAGQPPKGISRFPDGGTHKVIYENTGVYSYDIENRRLNKIFDYGYFPSLTAWYEQISYQNNTLVFSIGPTSGWDKVLNEYTNASGYKQFYENYAGFYLYNTGNGNIKRIKSDGYNPVLSPDGNQIVYIVRDSLGIRLHCLNISENKSYVIDEIELNSFFTKFVWKDNENIVFKDKKELKLFNLKSGALSTFNEEINMDQNKVSIKEIKELTSGITFKEWGFDIKKQWPKSNKEYIKDIIPLNGNLNYRKAIIEEIGGELSNDDIEQILKKMDEYKNSLYSYKRTEYEIFSQETIDLLKGIRELKNE